MSPAGTGRFGSVVTAMVTPFDDNGALDVEGAATLARWLCGHGSDALVVAGTTGEGPVLSDDECEVLWRTVADAVTVPVIAGTGSNDTRHTVALTKTATAAGVDAMLVVTPYYNRPSQAGLMAHFTEVAHATDLPVMLYDIPVRTGRKIAFETLVALSAVDNIVAVKDAAGDVVSAGRLVSEAADGFELYCGDDVLTLPMLAVGAVGIVSVAAHWAGEEMADMVAAFGKGDVETARRINANLYESFEFESTEAFPNPLPAKAACRALGLPAGQCRLPMGAASPDLDRRARAVLGGLGHRVGDDGTDDVSGGRIG